MAANEGNKYTNFSNVEIGTGSGGGALKVGGVQQNLDKTAVLSAAYTVTAEDSGKTFVFRNATGAAVTLPAVAVGLKFKFIVGAVFATSAWTVTTQTANKIHGVLDVNGAKVAAAGTDALTFAHAAESIGDWAELYSDGVYWYLRGAASLAGGITTA